MTLDFNPACKPDVLFDLDQIEHGAQLPFKDEEFLEIHAYEVMEHYGRIGDFRGFFCGMREFWRILKPGGYMIGTCPAPGTKWVFGDPGHTRPIQPETWGYLTRDAYKDLGKNTSSDYRAYVNPRWWEVAGSDVNGPFHRFALRKAE